MFTWVETDGIITVFLDGEVVLEFEHNEEGRALARNLGEVCRQIDLEIGAQLALDVLEEAA